MSFPLIMFYRQAVQDAGVSMLSAPLTGFNSRFAAYAPYYGVEAFVIDFSDTTENFAQTYISPENIEKSEVILFPGLVVYTTEDEDRGEPRGVPYAGDVILAMDLYLRLREGAEVNAEALSNCAEAAIRACFNDPTNSWPPGVLFSRRSKGTRFSVQPLADGYQQLVRVEYNFGSVSVSV